MTVSDIWWWELEETKFDFYDVYVKKEWSHVTIVRIIWRYFLQIVLFTDEGLVNETESTLN